MLENSVCSCIFSSLGYNGITLEFIFSGNIVKYTTEKRNQKY